MDGPSLLVGGLLGLLVGVVAVFAFRLSERAQHTVPDQIATGHFESALADLARLRAPVDAFFEGVMVMDPDPALRGNRLALLGQLRQLFAGIADLSRLPG